MYLMVTCGQMQAAMSDLAVVWIKKTLSPGSVLVLPAGYVMLEQCLNNEATLTLRLGYLAPCDLPNFEALVAAISATPNENNGLISQCLTALQKSLDGDAAGADIAAEAHVGQVGVAVPALDGPLGVAAAPVVPAALIAAAGSAVAKAAAKSRNAKK
jgi:hypothetical protein